MAKVERLTPDQVKEYRDVWLQDPEFAALDELLRAYAALNRTLVAERRFNKAARKIFKMMPGLSCVDGFGILCQILGE